jgi:hypothetical protein
MLTVGHTHEGVDLALGVLLAKVTQRHRIQCPPELATIITIGTAEWAATRGEVCHCTALQRRRDFAVWLELRGVRIHNCWMTRQGVDAPHNFAYKRRHGLMDQELLAVYHNMHVLGHDAAVFLRRETPRAQPA